MSYINIREKWTKEGLKRITLGCLSSTPKSARLSFIQLKTFAVKIGENVMKKTEYFTSL
jgi:hypothetical protein